MKEHDDMFKDVYLYHPNLEFIVIFFKIKIEDFFQTSCCLHTYYFVHFCYLCLYNVL